MRAFSFGRAVLTIVRLFAYLSHRPPYSFQHTSLFGSKYARVFCEMNVPDVVKLNLSNVKGVILCGGEGVRLRPLTYYFQKGMIPIGSGQKPLLEYIIRLLRRHGITDMCLLVGYKAEQIHNYFDEGSRFGVRFTYVYDRRGFGGTGGAVLNAYKQGLIRNGDETLLIYYGDILSNIDLGEMLKQHHESGAVATVAIVKGYRVPVGVVDLRDGRVERLVEKPILDISVGIGILALKGNALKSLEQLHQQGREMDLMRHLLPRLIEDGEPVHAYVTEAFWYDVGSTERYEKLSDDAIEEHLGYLFTP